jgi:hypothetical protein
VSEFTTNISSAPPMIFLNQFFFLMVYKFLFFKITYTLIHMCIHCLATSPPCPPPPPPTSLASRQNLFCPLLQFCWRENIRDNKKHITFLLAWDKDSYTERFLGLLPCTRVLQPKLIHLHQTLHYFPVTFP